MGLTVIRTLLHGNDCWTITEQKKIETLKREARNLFPQIDYKIQNAEQQRAEDMREHTIMIIYQNKWLKYLKIIPEQSIFESVI